MSTDHAIKEVAMQEGQKAVEATEDEQKEENPAQDVPKEESKKTQSRKRQTLGYCDSDWGNTYIP